MRQRSPAVRELSPDPDVARRRTLQTWPAAIPYCRMSLSARRYWYRGTALRRAPVSRACGAAKRSNDYTSVGMELSGSPKGALVCP